MPVSCADARTARPTWLLARTLIRGGLVEAPTSIDALCAICSPLQASP